MTNKKFVAIMLALGLYLSISCVLSFDPSGEASADLSGQWDMVANTNYHFILDLQQNGNQITGTMTSKDDTSLPVETISGTISGETIQFTRELAGQQTQVYTGSMSGSTITGTFNQNGQGQYPWSASKVQGLPTGTKLEMILPTVTTVEMKQESKLIQFADNPYNAKFNEGGEAVVIWDGSSRILSIDGYRKVCVSVACIPVTGFKLWMGKGSGSTLMATVATEQLEDIRIYCYDVIGPEMVLILTGPPNTNEQVQLWVYLIP